MLICTTFRLHIGVQRKALKERHHEQRSVSTLWFGQRCGVASEEAREHVARYGSTRQESVNLKKSVWCVPISALMPCDPGLLACGMRLSVWVTSSAICVEVFRDSCTAEWSNWVSVVKVHRLDLFRDAGAVMEEHVRKPIAPPLSRT